MFDNDLMFDDAEVINEPADNRDEDGFVITDEIDTIRAADNHDDEDEDA